MTLAERLAEYVRACFTGLWIESHEHDDALAEIAQLCRERTGGWRRGTSTAACVLARPSKPAPDRRPTRWPRSGRWARWRRRTAPPCWCWSTSTGS